MMRPNVSINPFALAAVTIIAATLLLVAVGRMTIVTDMTGAAPGNGPVAADGHHRSPALPIVDPIRIDIGATGGDGARLLAAAEWVETRLQQNDLFPRARNQPMPKRLADLSDQVIPHLPVLFTAGELQVQVAPLLTDRAIRQAMTRFRTDAPGQASSMAMDPLGLHRMVLARLAAMSQEPGAAIHRGRLFSADRRHVLILAIPIGSGTDATVARALTRFFHDLDRDLEKKFGREITLTAAGTFRTTLDNASMVKGDVQRIILWSATGIVVLLAACIRPLAGMLSLMPPLAGMISAFFIFSLTHDSISILVLGFGGLIVSISVNHGIAIMGLADDDAINGARHAAREIRAVGLPAVLAAVGAFGALAFSGIAVFEELGRFAAMGIGFSFLFAQTVFPLLLTTGRHGPTPAGRRLAGFTDRLTSAGWSGLALALLAAAVLAVFIRPPVATDRKAPQPASRETNTAEVRDNRFSDTVVMTEAADLAALQAKNDRLLELLETETHAGGILKALTPSLFFPGHRRSAENADAWSRFWTAERVQLLSSVLERQGAALGFADGEFDPFLKMITTPSSRPPAIPPDLQALLGISRDEIGGRWVQTTRITPREHFDRRRFNDRMSAISTVADPARRFPAMGKRPFQKTAAMLLILGAGLILLLVLFLADAGLSFTALLPPAFAVVCTAGTLGMTGRPPDIPATVLLSVFIAGPGAGYGLFLIRGCQRYQRFDHPHFSAVRTAMIMGAAATLVVVWVLPAADHHLFEKAGWIACCTIGYSLAGALLILPPLLKRRFEATPTDTGGIRRRYRNMAPCPRLMAGSGRRLGPLIGELSARLPAETDAANILDVGCGYGAPACWMADRYPYAIIHGIDPDPERVRAAALALGPRGRIIRGSAPDLPPMDVLVNLATMLDVSHHLQDWELEKNPGTHP
ncbi:methyltransferase domain-containing protein [Desulfosarcina alkanivorans]|nr:methyltransferase domain-containing protein [Desulfosarcina alkanivorans]